MSNETRMTDPWDGAAHRRVMEALCMSFYGTGWSDTSEFRRGICDNMAVAALTALGPALTPTELAAREAAAYQRGQEAMREAAALSCQNRAHMWKEDSWDRASAYRYEAACCADAIRALPIQPMPQEPHDDQ